MNREYNSRVSSKNSQRLLKNLKNTTGDYFFIIVAGNGDSLVHVHWRVATIVSVTGDYSL